MKSPPPELRVSPHDEKFSKRELTCGRFTITWQRRDIKQNSGTTIVLENPRSGEELEKTLESSARKS